MKKVLLLALGIVFSASLAFGQAGYIGLFSDAAHTNCNMTITDTGGTKRVYVYHMLSAGTTASMFGIETTGLVGGEDECDLSGISYQFTLVIGDPFFEAPYDTDNAGVAIAYGSCITTGAIYLFRITFACFDEMVPPPACSKLEVVPAPDAPSGTIEVVGCADDKLVGGGGRLNINPTSSCMECGPNPTKDSSWGKIKSLYNL